MIYVTHNYFDLTIYIFIALPYTDSDSKKKLGNTKCVIRCRKSKKDRQYNGDRKGQKDKQ